MEYGNSQMAAMQAQFEETIAKLRVQETANQTMREEREEAAKR